MCHNAEEWCKIWRGTDLCFEKLHEEFSEFWPNTEKSQNFHFIGLLLTKVYNVWAKSTEDSKILKFALWETYMSKVYNVELKNYREIMCHDTEGWCNI